MTKHVTGKDNLKIKEILLNWMNRALQEKKKMTPLPYLSPFVVGLGKCWQRLASWCQLVFENHIHPDSETPTGLQFKMPCDPWWPKGVAIAAEGVSQYTQGLVLLMTILDLFHLPCTKGGDFQS